MNLVCSRMKLYFPGTELGLRPHSPLTSLPWRIRPAPRTEIQSQPKLVRTGSSNRGAELVDGTTHDGKLKLCHKKSSFPDWSGTPVSEGRLRRNHPHGKRRQLTTSRNNLFPCAGTGCAFAGMPVHYPHIQAANQRLRNSNSGSLLHCRDRKGPRGYAILAVTS
jgi:hypothetical protein